MSVESGPLLRPDSASDVNLRDLLDIIARRKWVMLQAFLFVTIAGIVVTFLSPPVYSAAAKLVVETPGRVFVMAQVDTNSALAPLMALRQQKSMETQLAIMHSAAFRERVRARIPADHLDPRVSLRFSAAEKTDIVTVSAEASRPETASVWANTAATEYRELTRESNQESIVKARKFLEEATARAASTLQKAEKRMLEFQTRNAAAASENEQGAWAEDAVHVTGEARQTRTQLLTLESQIRGLRARLAQVPATLTETRSTPNPDIGLVKAELMKLRLELRNTLAHYQPGSSRVRDVETRISGLEQELRSLPARLEETETRPNPKREELQARLRDLEDQYAGTRNVAAHLKTAAAQQRRQLREFGPNQVLMNQLQRERSLSESTYLDYSSKLRDLDLRERSLAATASVMEPAVPPRYPIRPQRAAQIGMCMILGMALGVAFAFLQEFLDDRVNSADDSERITQLPTLGVVPMMTDGSNCLLLGQDVLSPITESYRELRTAIQYSTVDHPVQLMAVTSAHSGEGKSLTSANLAIAMALQGKRVILVDADLRRPSVHRMFGVESSPGLTNVLAGEMSLAEALRPTQLESLSILCSGPLAPNPPELLNSQAMADALDNLQEQADVIILDTPPTVLVTDAQILAGKVDGMVLVVEAGETRRGAVRHARDLLLRTRARVLGVVLNKIDRNVKGYYYRYSYRGGYGSYGQSRYFSRDEHELGLPELDAESPEAVGAGAGPSRDAGKLPARFGEWE